MKFLLILGLSCSLLICSFNCEKTISTKFEQYINKQYNLKIPDERHYYLVISGYNCPGVVENLVKSSLIATLDPNITVIISGIDVDNRYKSRSGLIIERRGELMNSNVGIILPVLIETEKGEIWKHTNIGASNMDSVLQVTGVVR